MDGASPMYPRRQDRDSGWGTGLLFSGIALVLVLIAFFFLNYFQVLSLSELYPQAFGWLPHQQTAKNTALTNKISNTDTTSGKVCAIGSPLFKVQSANIEGIITSVNESQLTVKSETNLSDSFPISNRIVIYTKQPDSKTVVSKEKTDIQVNKKALLLLEVIDGKYQVTGITY